MYIHDCVCIEEDREVGEGDICIKSFCLCTGLCIYIYYIYTCMNIYIIYNVVCLLAS